MLVETNHAGAVVISETGSKVECKRCGKIVSAKRDGSPRQHAGFVTVCGITTRQIH